MRFFKSKKKDVSTDAGQKDLQGDKVAETRRDLKSELDMAVVPALNGKEEKPAEVKTEAAADAPSNEVKEKPLAKNADKPARKDASETTMVRLFPGFENQPFEIGYAGFKSADYGIEEEAPMLLMRWKAGSAKWFPLPPMFNKAVLEQIHEEDNDLDRLLIGYGYDAEQLVR